VSPADLTEGLISTLGNGEAGQLTVPEAARRHSEAILNAYRAKPELIEEHANIERQQVEGGYGRRQLFELIQNGADELLGTRGRIAVVVTEDALYCANEGRPLSPEGIGALLGSHVSPKRGVEIGRFGLGFKSVLGISTTPEIFSTSGSIRFDPDVAARRIREVIADADRTPTLRTCTVIDRHKAEGEDPVLAELMEWATTVVRLRRDADESPWLNTDIRTFPNQFLVFSPHVEELVLDDRETGLRRSITARSEGSEFVLDEDGVESRWRVFATEHEPSERAAKDGGTVAERDRIPLVWAVPTRRGRRGEIWAFFPTLDQTTLSGVVNAPWKLNEDRTRVIAGPFNEELIDALSLLVVDNLPELAAPTDPGVLLELMPARGREAAGWADEVLTTKINALARVSPSVPDQTGELELPMSIELHPAGVPREVLDLWSSQPFRPDRWAHPSVETRDRRARVESYMQPREASSVADWLEALMGADRRAGSRAAITVAAALVRRDPSTLGAVRGAAIVLDQDGNLRRPEERDLFRRAEINIDADLRLVDEELDRSLLVELEALGVHTVDAERILDFRLRGDINKWDDTDWDQFWLLVRRSEPTRVLQLIGDHGVLPMRLKARNRRGTYHHLWGLLLPGEIVQEGSMQDAGVMIDTRFHSEELRIIRLLGLTAGPSREGGSIQEPWFSGYEHETRDRYLKSLEGTGSAPSPSHLKFSLRPFAGPLTILGLLSESARVSYTTALLNVADDLRPWRFGHTTQSRYPEVAVRHPVVRMVLKHGRLKTSLGPRKVGEAVGPNLRELDQVLPVASIPTRAVEPLNVPDALDALTPENWKQALERAAESSDDGVIGTVCTGAARSGIPAPDQIRCRVGHGHENLPTESVAVVHDDELQDVLTQTSQPFIRVHDGQARDVLIERWRLRDADDTVRSDVVALAEGDAEALGDAFRLLRSRLDAQQRLIEVQPCSDLYIDRFTESGRVREDRRFVWEPETLYHRSDLSRAAVLSEISRHLGLHLTEADIERVLRNVEAQRVQELRRAIRRATSDGERLLLAIGSDELRARVPRAVIEAVQAQEGRLDDIGLAELALIVHGPSVLQAHKDVLADRGLEPPEQWAGRRPAISFVRELGFSAEFAGFEPRRLDSALVLDGPPKIGPLHDYQEIIVGEIRELLRGLDGLRGLLSLPTGAGKTRVTIEALIDAIAAGELESPILWVAQTQELCEQAVQTWSELWRGQGPRRQLTVSRLWGPNSAAQVEYGEQVVVATIAKLDSGVMTNSSYVWLSNASCVVVDEAHTSITTAYTELLNWQGMPRGKERAPLIGLTATPFRGTNEVETRRLVSRYGGRRLDLEALGGADAYPHLQRMGILSQVTHELLPGSEIRLNPQELKQLAELRRLPDGAAQRLAGDTDRNHTLLESIRSLDQTWPVLLFAVSVEHAATMAALLSREGISAAAISSETKSGLRRYYIEQFRNEQLRVLTNFGVLAAGFDAPKVRAVYVARPTYTPNVYQQMIGRGLRGPKNGGTEQCLLVNVADNVLQFGDRLAFYDFDYLWNPDRVETEGSNEAENKNGTGDSDGA
jgi:superfamily II DNA or RNA helicase